MPWMISREIKMPTGAFLRHYWYGPSNGWGTTWGRQQEEAAKFRTRAEALAAWRTYPNRPRPKHTLEKLP